ASPWTFIAAYYGGIGLTWIGATLLTRFILCRSEADGASIAMGSCFGNTVMLGIPLALSAFGPEAAAPIGILVSLDSLVLWVMGTLHIEWASRTGRTGSFLTTLGGIIGGLLRNAVVMSVVIGT